jgi:hypothetical protein
MPDVTKRKYPSTPHVPWSPEKHRDDSYHPDINSFEGESVVVMEKMDGENLTIYSDGSWHARSLDTPYHPTREWAGKVAGEVGYLVPEGWRVCCENLYGKHSIKYTDLRSYVQVFGIIDDSGRYLDWGETVAWCELLDLAPVPVLWEGEYDRDLISSWTEDDINGAAGREAEGYVMRTQPGFPEEQFEYHVAKWVREDHVQTNEHWLETWEYEGEANELSDRARDFRGQP